MTGLMVRYKVIEISWLLSRDNLIGQRGNFEMYPLLTTALRTATVSY